MQVEQELLDLHTGLPLTVIIQLTVINSAQFSHLNPSITPGNHQ